MQLMQFLQKPFRGVPIRSGYHDPFQAGLNFRDLIVQAYRHIIKYKLPGSDLQGCVNDATNVGDVLLKYYGFTVKEVRVLADERAGDRLQFHFSGHGSQIRAVLKRMRLT